MSNHELPYLNICKQLIEKRLRWTSSDQWKQRDYFNLIGLIEDKSGIRLSLTTIKRIWKPNYSGTPHPSTLEALTLFLGYQSWLDFKTHHETADARMTFASKKMSGSKKNQILILLLLLLMAGSFGIMQLKTNNASEDLSKAITPTADVRFSYKNSTSIGVPNTVVFNYDLSGIEADSFFIQQSWNKFKRDKINKKDTTLTSIYYYPGVHQAKLIANNTVLKKTTIRINTAGWVSAARYGMMDNIPVYIGQDHTSEPGHLHVSRDQLLSNQVELRPDLVVSYYYVNEFKRLNPNAFTFETRMKSDSILNITCPKMGLMILGEKDVYAVSLTTPGCVGDLALKLGNDVIKGKNNDISRFGVDIYEWQVLNLRIEDLRVSASLNDKLVYAQPIVEDIGPIIGIHLYFGGTGLIDYVKLGHSEQKEWIYAEGF